MSREQLAAYLRLQADLKDRTRTHLRSYHDSQQGKKFIELPDSLLDSVRQMVKDRAGVRRIREELRIGTATLRRVLKVLGIRLEDVYIKPGKKP